MSRPSARALALLSGLAAVVSILTGCTQLVSGTPQPDPAQLAAPGLSTTCEEYSGLTDSAKRAVIAEIGEQNPLVERSPELWVTLAVALCTFSDPDATVKDVLEGQGVR